MLAQELSSDKPIYLCHPTRWLQEVTDAHSTDHCVVRHWSWDICLIMRVCIRLPDSPSKGILNFLHFGLFMSLSLIFLLLFLPKILNGPQGSADYDQVVIVSPLCCRTRCQNIAVLWAAFPTVWASWDQGLCFNYLYIHTTQKSFPRLKVFNWNVLNEAWTNLCLQLLMRDLIPQWVLCFPWFTMGGPGRSESERRNMN